MKKETVVILGASDKPERYSYKAFKKLQEHGHETLLVSPRLEQVEGHIVESSLSMISKCDTLTIYVNPAISTNLKEEIINLSPKRVIFNPGSENQDLMIELKALGIDTFAACTLILLSTDQF